jgi:putative phosphoesterase
VRRPATTTIGVISDTHGLLRASALDALRDCSMLVHAGDIGKPAVLDGLRAIAPLVAVRGNVDARWAHDIAETADVALAGWRIHVLHNLGELAIDPVAEAIDIVISGHSHVPRIERRGGVLFVNPGSAGPRRFKLPIAVARLTLGPDATASIVTLEN